KTENDVLQRFIDSVIQICDWRVGHIYFIDYSKEQPRIICSNIWSFDQDHKYKEFKAHTMKSDFENDISLPGTVLKKRKSCWIKEIFEVTHLTRAKSGTDEGLKGAFGLPIFSFGKIFAIAEFFSPKPIENDQDLLNIIEIAGVQIGIL